MNEAAVVHTPWRWSREVERLAEGIWRVSTPGHGGLMLDGERWEDPPGPVRESFITPAFAEEDCEEPIARTMLGLAYEREQGLAVRIAKRFPRYSPACPTSARPFRASPSRRYPAERKEGGD